MKPPVSAAEAMESARVERVRAARAIKHPVQLEANYYGPWMKLAEFDAADDLAFSTCRQACELLASVDKAAAFRFSTAAAPRRVLATYTLKTGWQEA